VRFLSGISLVDLEEKRPDSRPEKRLERCRGVAESSSSVASPFLPNLLLESRNSA